MLEKYFPINWIPKFLDLGGKEHGVQHKKVGEFISSL